MEFMEDGHIFFIWYGKYIIVKVLKANKSKFYFYLVNRDGKLAYFILFRPQSNILLKLKII
jgi:hypothetical protein